MKKIIIALVLCLTWSLSASSQTNLSNPKDTTCCVPCLTLRHALIMKNDYKLQTAVLGVTRDSLNIIVKQSAEKDSLINDYKTIILVKNNIIDLKDGVITERENQTVDLNKNITTVKKQRNTAYGVAGISIILTILFGLVK